LIVIDAGHGGQDPGAVGRSGTLEKTVALATAVELGRQLRATGRYRVLLTRDRDIFVPLAARLRIVARSGAALLVSIHADADPSPRARGASVYVRSPGPEGRTAQFPAHRGAAPAMAEALAGPPPGSELLQLMMVGRLDDDLRMTASPARRAQLYVLAATNVPGVLVEMGYISNRKDEALLRSQRHRVTVANAIRDAVDQYFGKQRQARDART
jgi:N-acetylmuramoyl-L-alanine amidase